MGQDEGNQDLKEKVVIVASLILKSSQAVLKEIKLIYSQVLQDCVKREKLTFDRRFKVDKNGQRLGKPRFMGKTFGVYF